MKFKLLAELPNVNFLCTSSFHRFLNEELLKLLGKGINSFSVFEKGNCRMYLEDENWGAINKILFSDFLANPDKLIDYHKTIKETAESFFEFCREFQKNNFSDFSNKGLVDIFERFYLEHTKNHHSGLLDALLELYGEKITNHIKQLIAKKVRELGLKIDVSEALSILTTPVEHSHINKEKIDLIRIALEIFKGDESDMDELIGSQHEKYSWIGYMFIGPALEKKYFSERLDQYLERRDKILEDLGKILNKGKVKERQEQFLKELDFDEIAKKQIQIAQEILYFKVLRKDSMVHGWFSADGLIAEISKRLGIDRRLTGFLMPNEVREALLNNKLPSLEQRFQTSLTNFQGGKEDIILGEEALKLEKSEIGVKETELVDEIKGTCAYNGKAKGVVKIVNVAEDIKKVSKGDILVSYATNPDLILAMEKAAAFVTDRGGLTCHAAIVAREMEKPCIVGTENATKVLKDGDLVEVDAGEGIVRVLERAGDEF
ncbi:MAG: PEP-utilizing enzyme [Nanoarchaeota archaeon]